MDYSTQPSSFIVPIVIVFVVVFLVISILRCCSNGCRNDPTTYTDRIAALENGQVIIVPQQRVVFQPTAPPLSTRRPTRRSVSNDPPPSVNIIGSAYNPSEDLPPSYDVVMKPSPRY